MRKILPARPGPLWGDRLAQERVGSPSDRRLPGLARREVVDEQDAGDHTIVVGAVHELASSRASAPLVVFRGGYGRLALDL